MRNNIISFILFVFFQYSLLGQEFTPVFENITEGLPSTEVHDIFQDSLGYMWFATDRGICRYDGDRIKTNYFKSNLKTKVVFKLFKQNESKVWILTGDNLLFWFNPFDQTTIFHPHKLNDQLNVLLRNEYRDVYIANAYFEKNDIILSARNQFGFIKLGENSGCKWVNRKQLTPKNIELVEKISIEARNGLVYTKSLKESESNSSQRTLKIQTYNEQISLPTESSIKEKYDFGVADVLESDDDKYFAISNVLFKLHDGKLSYKVIASRILSLAKYKKDILIGTYAGLFRSSENLNTIVHSLTDNLITNIFVDGDELVWLSTYSNGILKSMNLDSKHLVFREPINIGSLYSLDQGIILHDKVRKEMVVYDLMNGFSDRHIQHYMNKYTVASSEPKTLNSLSKAGDLFELTYIKEAEKYKRKDNVTRLFMQKFEPIDYFVVKGLINYTEGGQITNIVEFPGISKANFGVKIQPNKLLVGTTNGLFYFNPFTKKVLGKVISKTEENRFHSSLKLGGLVLMTSNRGLHYFSNAKFKDVQSEVDFSLKNLIKQNDTTAWTFSDHKIYRIELINGVPEIEVFPVNLGNPNASLISIALLKDELWTLTNDGVFLHPLNQANNKSLDSKFKFTIDSILVNSNRQSNYETVSGYSGSSIKLYFNTICFDRYKERDLEYSIDGINWYEADKNSIVFRKIEKGDHLCQVRRVSNPKDVLFEIRLHIKNRFYQEWWFYLGVFLIISLCAVALARRIYAIHEKRREDELIRLQLELKLLSSKMNPHFTFNTINSIQYYIMNNDKKEAIAYLSDFALLMRKSLDFSMEESITLSQEKEFLELYVKMENKRFDSGFVLNFTINQTTVEMDMKIPSMLVQPLIENVILHANYPENAEKIINVNFDYSEGFFTIKVIDYGCGITNTGSLKNHKSYGLEILKSRVKLYNGKDFNRGSVLREATDKENNTGTTIKILLKEWKQ